MKGKRKNYGIMLSALCGALMAAEIASATITVDFIGQPGQRFVADGVGTPLPAGSVAIGTFSVGFDPAVPDLTSEQFQAAWSEFGGTEIREIAGEAGRFSDTVSNDGGAFGGSRIYLWVTGDPDSSDGFAIFSSSASSWTFPMEGSPPPLNATLISTDDVDQVFGTGSILAESLRLEGVVSRSPYDSWVAAIFPDGSGEEITAGSADPDLDGWSNEMEFLMGTDPLNLREMPKMAVAYDAAELVLSFNVSFAANVGDFAFEKSTDAVDWSGMAPTELRIVEMGGLRTLEAAFRPVGDTGFYRVRASL